MTRADITPECHNWPFFQKPVRATGFVMTRRLFQLFSGLILYGLSIALIVRADLGLDPWDVLNQGVFERFAQPAGSASAWWSI